ncbi:hypothetical protein Tco_0378947 [Tanacetum coccineum]
MLPPTATPSTSNTMLPPPTPSTSNTMSPPPTPSPSTSNTMPPPSGSNTMPPPPTPSSSNTMSSHATAGSNTSTCSNTMPSHAASASTGTNKGKSLLIPKKEADLPKVVLLATEVVLGVVQPTEVVLGMVQPAEVVLGVVYAKEDESSDEENQFKMDMKAVYEMEKEQMAIDEDDQFWEECAREFDHVEDVAAEKQPLTEDVTVVKNP